MTDNLAVIAVGGNALTKEDEAGTYDQILANTWAMAEGLRQMVEQGWRAIVVHGNGPQVGSLALQQDAGAEVAPPQPFPVLAAMSQGQLGSLLVQCVDSLIEPGSAAAMVTHAVVDANDPAFAHPTKPVGPFYSKDRADELAATLGWTMVADAGRGYRRVVASPLPTAILEARAIRALTEFVPLVIAAGGGGVPVVRTEHGFEGVSGVIDKDAAAAWLAAELKADALVLVTAVDTVMLDFGTPEQRPVGELTLTQAEQYLAEGQFPPGSMGPKVAAAIRFAAQDRGTAVITSADYMVAALDPNATVGTRIVPSAVSAEGR